MMPAGSSTSRVRPGIRRLAIAAVVVLTPIAAFQVWDLLETRRLLAEVAQVEAAGETLDERRAPGARPYAEPSQAEAGRHYLAAGLLALGSSVAPPMQAARAWVLAPAEPPPTAIVASLQEALARARPALDLVKTASVLPYSGLPAGTDYSFRFASLQALGTVLAADVFAQSAANDGDGAARSALALVRLRLPQRDVRWTTVPALPLGALLSLSSPGEPVLSDLQTAILAADRAGGARARFIRERARMFEFGRVAHGVDARSRGVLEPRSQAWQVLVRPLAAYRTTRSLRRWAVLSPLLDGPWTAIEPVLRAVPRDGTGDWADQAFRQAALDPTVALDRVMVAAIAAARFARHHDGNPPPTLAALVPSYLSAVPTDPFGTGPLRYRPDGRRYIVYSVGPDGVDDGGELASTAPPGALRLPGTRGADVGVRVALDLAPAQSESRRLP